MTHRKIIRGSGGSPSSGSPRTPVESQDSLRSRSTAKIIDLTSEGEIEGFIDGDKGVFLNETPLENADGTKNFTGIEIVRREGTQDQTFVPGFNTVENEFFVNVKVIKDVPIVRSIVSPSVDSVKIRISVPQLTSQDTSTGDVNGSSVQYKIELQSDGGGFVEVLRQTITGKTTSKYQRSHPIELEGDSPWDIRVTRLTDDDASINLQSSIYFEALTEIVNAKLRYPNSALVALTIDSSQFSNVPERAYKARGLKIKIPDNATVNEVDGSLTYSGSWSGDFSIAWTTNPAWILYDLLTTPRYGLGSYITEDQIDKWGLYTIGRYCDERVSNGFSGTEPRFSCGLLYLQSQAEAFQVIQNISSIFRGMSYWAAGAISVTQDSPSDPVTQFTQANVVDGRFTYMGSSAKARHSVALVTYNDPEDFYRQKVEYVEDADAIRRLGYVSTQVFAVGCTSRSQAHRLGKWIIYTEQFETETVTFKVGVEGSLVRPGQVFYVADKLRAAKRIAGRIYTATTSQVIIDFQLEDDPTGGQIACRLPDGSMEIRTIAGMSGRTLSITPDFTTAPQAHSIWSVSSPELQLQTFRAVTITETDRGLFEITGLAYNESKFDAVETGIKLQERSITSLTSQPSSPDNLRVEESLYAVAGAVKSKAVFSWDRVNNATEYQVSYKKDQGNFISLPTVYNNEIEILDVNPGEYIFSVVALSSLGKKSLTSSLEQELYGKTSPPVDVSGFSIFPYISNSAVLRWNQATDLDVLNGGHVRIRWTPVTADPEWGSSIDIIEALAGTSTSSPVPLLNGTYFAKFVDSSGNESVNVAEIQTTVPFGNALNVVHTETETGVFSGTKTNCEYDSSLGGLIISSSLLFDDLGLIDDLTGLDFLGENYNAAIYYFANTVDLGDVYPCRLISYIDVEGFDENLLWDDITDNIDDLESVDGEAIGDVNAILYVRTTLDDPSGSPTWDEWRPVLVGEYTARGFQFKLEMSTETQGHNILIKALSMGIDMPDRTENHVNVSSGTGTYSLAFDYAFWEIPANIITSYNMGTGDYNVISNQSKTGFDIAFKNSAGVGVSRNFDAIIKGFGRIAS